MEILTREHKNFKKFCDLLEGKEGCNFHKGHKGIMVWECKGGMNKSLATKILKKHFPNVDIEKTLTYFESKGGHCDCEIIFNVAED